jgi:type II secretory pathway pseudopilin PulG
MEQEPVKPETVERSDSALARLHETRLPLWVSLVLLVLLIAALAWRQLGMSAAERRFEAERQQLVQQTEAQRAALRTRAQQALSETSDDAHVLFGTALAWAVRSAMIRKNLDEVDQYFSTLVQHPRIPLALLADTQGAIVLASDRSLLGAKFAGHFPPALLEATAVTVHPGEGEQRRLVLPIHGLTERLGTVIVVYAAPALRAN